MGHGDDLIRRRERVVCRGVGRLSAMTAATASGAVITDADGREFIDLASGIGVLNVGHGDEAVVAAIREQAGRLLHVSTHVATYEPYVALCEKLVELFPHGGETRAMLVNTGAEAVENAIKIARQATGRGGVICFTGAFHGRTLLATTMTSKVSYKTGCGPFAPEVYRLPFPAVLPYEGLSEAEVATRELARLRAAFKDTVAPENVAAIAIELVQGEGGFCVAPRAYLEGLREICDEHGIVLIFDEVQTGFCRTGAWAASEHFGVTPDLSTWAKALGGGLPVSAVVGRASVMDRVTPGTLGGTYGGNPVACAAGLAAIRRMDELGLNERAREIGGVIRRRFESMAAQCPWVTDVRGLGAMLAFELCEGGDPASPAAGAVKEVIKSCHDAGVLVISAGVRGNVIRTLAPLVITDEQLGRALDVLEEAVMRQTGIGLAGRAGGA